MHLAAFVVPFLSLASFYLAVYANASRNITVSALDTSILYTPAKHWAKTDNYSYAVANQSFAKFTFTGVAFYYYDSGIPPHHDGSVYKFSLDNGAESVHTWQYSNPSDSKNIQSSDSTLIQAYTGLENTRHTVEVVFEPPPHSSLRVKSFVYTSLDHERNVFNLLEDLTSNGGDTPGASRDQLIIDSYNWISKRCNNFWIALGVVGGLFGLLIIYTLNMCRAPAKPKPKPPVPEEAMRSGKD